MIEGTELTGYPSIDKPWLKYYTKEAILEEIPQCSIFECIWNNNRNHLNQVALNYYGRKITYGTVFKRIKATSNAFYSAGVRRGDIVTICSVTLPETIYALYGLNRIGAVSNMIDPRTSIRGLASYMNEVHSKVVVVIDAAYSKIIEAVKDTSVERIVVISPADSLPQPQKTIYRLLKAPKIKKDNQCISWNDFITAGNQTSSARNSYKPDDPCVIVHTGGTTGNPKGVILSNDNLNAAAYQAIEAGFDFQRDHTWLNIMPPFVAYGVGNGLHLPLVTGMEVIIIPAFDANKFADLLNKYHPNHMVGVPSHYGSLIHDPRMEKQDLSYVIAPVVGGDAMDTRLEREVNAFLSDHNCSYPICKGYGMSEVAAAVCACSSHQCNKIASVGTPWPKTIISAFDISSGEELQYNQIGEICITGPNTMISYYQNDAETRKVIREHCDGELWVHSGDMGYIDEDGFVFIVDRIKRMIVRYDGFKVFPTLIENTIIKHNDIISCCVVGQKDRQHSQGQRPVVFAVLKQKGSHEETEIENELRRMCQEKLPEYAQPVWYMFIDALPLTPIGKVDFQLLEKEANSKL